MGGTGADGTSHGSWSVGVDDSSDRADVVASGTGLLVLLVIVALRRMVFLMIFMVLSLMLALLLKQDVVVLRMIVVS